jgi:hypothetical protein
MAGVVDAYSDINAHRIPCNLSDFRPPVRFFDCL